MNLRSRPPIFSSINERPSGGVDQSPHLARRGVVWLFATRSRTARRTGFGLYFLISVLGVMGFITLLILSAAIPRHAVVLREAALIWFVLLGAFRITTFWRR